MSKTPCEECSAPATHVGRAQEVMDDPDRPWLLCALCVRVLTSMKRVKNVRKRTNDEMAGPVAKEPTQ